MMPLLYVRRPGEFLGLFALAALVLLPLWYGLEAWYAGALAAAVDVAGQWTGLPPRLAVSGPDGGAPVNPGIVAGIALFVATPGRGIGWKAAWIGSLVLLWWGLQAALMLSQIHLAHAQHLAQLPWAQRLGHETPLMAAALSGPLAARLVEWGPYWTHPVVNVLVWVAAVGRR